jgi:hypothetical protein
MENRTRSLVISILIFFGVLLSIGRALAADYSIDFAVHTDAGDEVGAVLCSFDDTCGSNVKSLGLRFTVMVFRRSPERAYVNLYGPDVSCCYFANAARSITIDRRKPLSRVPFYSGHVARGDLFIQNKYAGRSLSELPLALNWH